MQLKLNQLLLAIMETSRQQQEQYQELVDESQSQNTNTINNISSSISFMYKNHAQQNGNGQPILVHKKKSIKNNDSLPLTMTRQYNELKTTTMKIKNSIEELSQIEKNNRNTQAKFMYRNFFKILQAVAQDVRKVKKKYNQIDKEKLIDEKCVKLARGIKTYREECKNLREQIKQKKKKLNEKVAENEALRIDNKGCIKLFNEKIMAKQHVKQEYILMNQQFSQQMESNALKNQEQFISIHENPTKNEKQSIDQAQKMKKHKQFSSLRLTTGSILFYPAAENNNTGSQSSYKPHKNKKSQSQSHSNVRGLYHHKYDNHKQQSAFTKGNNKSKSFYQMNKKIQIQPANENYFKKEEKEQNKVYQELIQMGNQSEFEEKKIGNWNKWKSSRKSFMKNKCQNRTKTTFIRSSMQKYISDQKIQEKQFDSSMLYATNKNSEDQNGNKKTRQEYQKHKKYLQSRNFIKNVNKGNKYNTINIGKSRQYPQQTAQNTKKFNNDQSKNKNASVRSISCKKQSITNKLSKNFSQHITTKHRNKMPSFENIKCYK